MSKDEDLMSAVDIKLINVERRLDDHSNTFKELSLNIKEQNEIARLNCQKQNEMISALTTMLARFEEKIFTIVDENKKRDDKLSEFDEKIAKAIDEIKETFIKVVPLILSVIAMASGATFLIMKYGAGVK